MSETPVTGSQFELEDLIEIVERRRWWIALGVLAGVSLGLVAFFVLPPSYEATTTLLVEPQEVPKDYIRSTVTESVRQRLTTLQQRVTSFANLNALIDRIGSERLDPDGELSREAQMGRIRGGVEVRLGSLFRQGANVVEVVYSDEDSQLAADVLREITKLFVDEHIKDRTQQATATAQFLDRELDRLRKQVAEQEAKIRAFRFERMGSLPSQLQANLAQLERLNAELAANMEAQLAQNQQIHLLRRYFATAETSGEGSAGSLAALLRQARLELIEARRIYTEEHPQVIRLHAEVAELEARLRQGPAPEEDPLLDPAMIALRPELEAAKLELGASKRQEQRIRKQIAEIQSRVEETPQREEEHLSLTRDYKNLTETYRSLLAKKYEAELARDLELAQLGERFKLLRPARAPTLPAWPDIRILLPASAAVGLALAALCIAIAEFRNPAFRSVGRLTRTLGLPVFASIPRIDSDQLSSEEPSVELDPKLVAFTAPDSAPAEQYRGFLPTFLEAEDCQVILVTSAARGDGKSLTCINLAITLATDLNKNVLVIDGDLRRPTAHRLLHETRRMGLSNVLTGEAKVRQCAVNSKIPNVTLLPAGPSVRNPITLLTNQAFFDMLDEVRKHHDVILIDSPPLLPVVDSRILRKIADMVLFVVRADATPREGVVRSLGDITDVAGVIFNQVSPGSFRRYYYYDAYSEYAYGDPPDSDEAGGVRHLG